MQVYGIGSCKTIDEFVNKQMSALRSREQSFESVFEIMFSERDNVMFETTDGNKIFKTTYGEVYEAVNQSAYYLKQHISTPEGSIIGMYMDNSIEWIEIFWAILKSGRIPLLMNKCLDIDVLEDLIKTHNVSAVITDSKEFSAKTINYKEIDKGAQACELGKCLPLVQQDRARARSFLTRQSLQEQ